MHQDRFIKPGNKMQKHLLISFFLHPTHSGPTQMEVSTSTTYHKYCWTLLLELLLRQREYPCGEEESPLVMEAKEFSLFGVNRFQFRHVK